ncbi:MAG: ROK family protein [Coprobacter sp.]|nr:ROK family protein [Coprobacter sp.]
MKPYVIGIDMGGTNTVSGIVDARGTVIDVDTIKTATYAHVEDYVDALCHSVICLMKRNDALDKIAGIGVGAPNANYFTGEIEQAANLPWKGAIPLARMLNERLHLPVAMTNDANAAAIGEMTYGAARGVKDFIMITLGTGVGSGVVANGRLIYGHDGNAGELGHIIVQRGGRLCGCGRRGCLEAYTSATGLARTAREYLELRDTPSSLRAIPMQDITSRDVYDAAIAGDMLAKEIFEYTGKILGEAFADFVAFTGPRMIVLFGGLARAGELLLQPTKKYMEANLLPFYRDRVEIVLSRLNEADAAILGAAALGWEAE